MEIHTSEFQFTASSYSLNLLCLLLPLRQTGFFEMSRLSFSASQQPPPSGPERPVCHGLTSPSSLRFVHSPSIPWISPFPTSVAEMQTFDCGGQGRTSCQFGKSRCSSLRQACRPAATAVAYLSEKWSIRRGSLRSSPVFWEASHTHQMPWSRPQAP